MPNPNPKPGPGRHPLPEAQRKATTLQIRLTPADRARYNAAAAAKGLALSLWVRRCLDRATITPPETPARD